MIKVTAHKFDDPKSFMDFVLVLAVVAWPKKQQPEIRSTGWNYSPSADEVQKAWEELFQHVLTKAKHGLP